MNLYIWLSIGLTVFVLIFVLFIKPYNRLKVTRNQIENATSVLDALFIKRSDLIPNLIAVVKQYTQYEKNLLNEIVSKRTQQTGAPYQQDGDAVEAMKKLMIQVENYPELQASGQFTNLQYSWNEVEEQISAGRRFLSSSITEYNNTVSQFPGNIVAPVIGMRKYEWQFATAAQRESPSADKLF